MAERKSVLPGDILFFPQIDHIHRPFRCDGPLPAIFRVYSNGYRPSDTPKDKVIALGYRALYRGLRQVDQSEHPCEFATAAGETSRFKIHSGNTQFSALYHPRYHRGYEIDVSVFLERILSESDVFYDIGSNWGYFSLFAASLPSVPRAIHAFEPVPDTYSDLDRVVGETGSASRITTHHLALSSEDGTVHMEFADGLHSGIARIGGDDPSGIPVETARLDGLTELPPPTVCKIDVEGHESSVLRGAERVFRESKPHLVFESGSLEPLRMLEEAFDCVLFVPVFERPDTGEGLMTRHQFDDAWDGEFPFRFGLKPIRAEESRLFPAPNLVAIHRDRVGEVAERAGG